MKWQSVRETPNILESLFLYMFSTSSPWAMCVIDRETERSSHGFTCLRITEYSDDGLRPSELIEFGSPRPNAGERQGQGRGEGANVPLIAVACAPRP